MAKFADNRQSSDYYSQRPSGDDLLRSARAGLLKAFFQDPRMDQTLKEKVQPLLDLQFASDTKTEIGGAIDIDVRSGEVTFRVAQTSFYIEVKRALEMFIQGEQREAAPTLIAALDHFTQGQSDEFRKSVILSEKSIYTRLKQVRDGELDRVSDESSEKIVHLIELGLRHSYFTSQEDLQTGNKGFTASFHIHSDASEPSTFDLRSSAYTDFPDVVISASADYSTTGFKLFVVNNGSFQEIYPSNTVL